MANLSLRCQVGAAFTATGCAGLAGSSHAGPRHAGAHPRRAPEGPGRLRQGLVYRAGVLGHRPTVPTDFGELERRAQAAMSPRAWAYVAGVGRRGRDGPRQPRGLRPAPDRAPHAARPAPPATSPPSCSDVGCLLPSCSHPWVRRGWSSRDSDLEIGRAAASLGLPYILSNQGCSPMEDVAAAMGSAPRWFQLYWSTDEPLVDSLLARAEASGAEARGGHAGHHDAGLATPGPQPGVPAVLPGDRHRAVHLRPPVPAGRRRAGGGQAGAAAPRTT